MTVADNTSRNQYTATPSQALFAYTFEIVDKDDIVVLINGIPLSEGTDYTVTGVGSDTGGNIVLTSGTTGGNIVTIYRDMPYARTQNYTNSGDFLASEVNSDFDNLWLAGEQTNRSFSQSIRKPITDSDSISMELPEAADRANKFVKFDANGAVDVAGATVTVAADAVTISDAGNYYTSNDVEGALQEVGADLDSINTDLGTKLSNVVEDTTPQLGGDLDLNSNDITGTGNVDITGTVTTEGAVTMNSGTNQVLLSNDGGIEITRSISGAYIDFKNSTAEDNDVRIAENSGGINITGSTIIDGVATIGGTSVSGVEGGEIQLTKPPTTNLAGDVSIDLNGDKIRFFENGGNARGAYIDVTDCFNNATSEIWHSGNDGAGSGLDADTLDGLQSATAATASTIVARDGSGNITAADLTASGTVQSDNLDVGSSSQFTVTNIGKVTTSSYVDANSYRVGATSVIDSSRNIENVGNITLTGTVDGRDVAADGTKLDGIAAGAEVNAVDSVNTQTGAVVLDADDIDDSATTHKFTTASDISKLAGIEAGADVTDTANVTAAGAVMDSELTNESAVKALDQGVATTDSPSFAGLTVDTNTLKVDSTNNRVGILNANPDVALDVGSATDAVHVPVGTTAERPSTPAAGYLRYNSTTGKFEGYTTEWGSIGEALTDVSVDSFTGNGSTTAFTLSGDPGSENNLQVYVDGVYQNKDTFTVVSTTLTFSEAPPLNALIEACTLNEIGSITVPADGSVNSAKIAGGAVTSSKLGGDLTTPGNLDVTGNVRIGTVSTTGTKLYSYGASGHAATFYSNSGGATTGLSPYGITLTGNMSNGSAGTNIVYGSSGGGLAFNSFNGTTATERLRIDSSGNVGIDTTDLTDSYKTIIEGSDQETANLTDAGTHGATLFLRAIGENVGSGGAVAFGTTFGNKRPFAAIKGYVVDGTANSAGSLSFSTRASTSATTLTERMRLHNDGRLSIGTFTPQAKLDVKSDGQYNPAAYFRNDGNAVGWARADWYNDQASGSGIVYRDQAGTFSFRNDNSSGIAMETSIMAGNTTAGNIVFRKDATAGGEVGRFDTSGNLLVGGTATPASSQGNLALFNGVVPTGSVTDGIVLYAEDVSSSSELKVRDEAGNITTLSPHNFDLIPEGPSEDMAWAYFSEKDGKRINVDMLKAIRLLERISGEKLVFEN